ncbi:MAG: DNA mismatch repair endonuclease MutL, partial [Thermodesulfobacteriota bacterium]
PELAAKIAAGEVVERPSSVVKELMENSIDAGASSISIYIKDGGKRLIRVVDDGEGMQREDALMAFERHATSKVKSEEDLVSINMMGFRGEAIPSIASVAEVTLNTKVKGSVVGTLVRVQGSKTDEVSDHGCADGTAVEVKDLFFNTPARRKFLRTTLTEFGHIKDTVERIALAHPSIAFKLLNGRNIVLKSSPKDMKGRIRDLFGRRYEDGRFVNIGFKVYNIEITGYISTPDLTYATTKGFYTYVNKRWIKDKGLNRSIIEACRNLFMEGRFPICVLFLTLPLDEVDINVHPAKSEVRFRSPMDIYRQVSLAVKNALVSTPFIGRSHPMEVNESEVIYKRPADISYLRAEDNESFSGVNARINQEERLGFESHERVVKNPLFLELQIVGQLWHEYLLCSKDDEFYIIDQHASAERILFEKLRNNYYANPKVKSQLLLVHEMLDMSASEIEAIEASLPFLSKLGFDLEHFGSNTFIVKAVPELLSGRDCRDLLKDLAEEISTIGVSSRIEEKIDDLLQKIACHGVIRGARGLAREEALSLLSQLSATDLSSHCPHGRPAVRVIKKSELEEMFKRK